MDTQTRRLAQRFAAVRLENPTHCDRTQHWATCLHFLDEGRGKGMAWAMLVHLHTQTVAAVQHSWRAPCVSYRHLHQCCPGGGPGGAMGGGRPGGAMGGGRPGGPPKGGR